MTTTMAPPSAATKHIPLVITDALPSFQERQRMFGEANRSVSISELNLTKNMPTKSTLQLPALRSSSLYTTTEEVEPSWEADKNEFQRQYLLAQKGNAKARVWVGDQYMAGSKTHDVEQNFAKAVQWYKLASSQGNPEGICSLAYCYQMGYFFEKDDKRALELYEKAAALDYPKALCCLGFCYKTGLGVEPDWAKGIEYYKKAARLGEAQAQYNIGYCLQHGEGLEQDFEKAIQYLKLAAKQGFVDALVNIANRYANGDMGMTENKQKAVKYYRKAAYLGHVAAQFNLGCCYANGTGIDPDVSKAMQWFERAAEQDYAHAQFSLGLCYEQQQDWETAANWYQEAANQNHARAQNNLGYCLQHGKGVKEDLTLAVEYLEKAAAQGLADAQVNLGNGCAEQQDWAAAAQHYQQAKALGHTKAASLLTTAEEKLAGQEAKQTTTKTTETEAALEDQ